MCHSGIVKESGNSFENILKSGITSRGVGFHKSRIVFLPEHISQTSPLPADEEGGSSHLLQSEISRNCSEVDFCPRTWKQCVFLRRNCFLICSSLSHSALMLAQRKRICGKVTEQNLNWGLAKLTFDSSKITLLSASFQQEHP